MRVIRLSPAQELPLTTSVKVIVGFGSQTSVAVAEPVADGADDEPHSTVRLAGQVMVGGVVSLTLINCTQLSALPVQSVALKVRVIRLSPVQEFPVTTSVKVIAGLGSQTSVAVAVPVADGADDAPHSIVRFAGQVMVGGVTS